MSAKIRLKCMAAHWWERESDVGHWLMIGQESCHGFMGWTVDLNGKCLTSFDTLRECRKFIVKYEREHTQDIRTMPIEQVNRELAEAGIDPQPLIDKLKAQIQAMKDAQS